MSFGLTNAPTTFMDFMNTIFKPYLNIFVLIDDILIYSRIEEYHASYLRIVHQTLQDKYLCAQFSKCDFYLKCVALLGHIVSSDVIRVDAQKIEVVQSWPRPTYSSDIRSFDGLYCYYRMFFVGFSSILSPLTKFT